RRRKCLLGTGRIALHASNKTFPERNGKRQLIDIDTLSRHNGNSTLGRLGIAFVQRESNVIGGEATGRSRILLQRSLDRLVQRARVGSPVSVNPGARHARNGVVREDL